MPGIGDIGSIIDDFKQSISQIFGGAAGSPDESIKGGSKGQLFDPKYGGSNHLDKSLWVGNTKKPNTVKYSFIVLTQDEIIGSRTLNLQALGANNQLYTLTIPPQAISQKEIFSNNITATRKGVIVETEGVIFKDIVIQGTTGVFPGQRASANNAVPNFADFTSPPQAAAGVDAKTGMSKNSSVTTISGYEEFLRLRQFFLKYANKKVQARGNLFLVFLNEKDNQNLIVEPIEFVMDRNAKSPLTYDYKIVLKAIGTLDAVISSPTNPADKANKFFQALEDIGNVAANVSATIGAARAVINQSTRMLQRISQSIDQTFINPLRQIQFALQDFSNGL